MAGRPARDEDAPASANAVGRALGCARRLAVVAACALALSVGGGERACATTGMGMDIDLAGQRPSDLGRTADGQYLKLCNADWCISSSEPVGIVHAHTHTRTHTHMRNIGKRAACRAARARTLHAYTYMHTHAHTHIPCRIEALPAPLDLQRRRKGARGPKPGHDRAPCRPRAAARHHRGFARRRLLALRSQTRDSHGGRRRVSLQS